MNTADDEWAARDSKRLDLVDRAGWPPGEWDNEPDRVEWRYHGTPRFPLLLIRAAGAGAWCGYVGVPPGHPCHGRTWREEPTRSLRVHGGVNFAEACEGIVCHAARPGESHEMWWLGFDCAHGRDMHPMLLKHAMPDVLRQLLNLGQDWEYRTIDYVRGQVERLAEQLSRLAKGLPMEDS